MIMKMFFKNISLSVKTIFQMLPMQNMLSYLPQCNRKRLVEYRLKEGERTHTDIKHNSYRID